MQSNSAKKSGWLISGTVSVVFVIVFLATVGFIRLILPYNQTVKEIKPKILISSSQGEGEFDITMVPGEVVVKKNSDNHTAVIIHPINNFSEELEFFVKDIQRGEMSVQGKQEVFAQFVFGSLRLEQFNLGNVLMVTAKRNALEGEYMAIFSVKSKQQEKTFIVPIIVGN